MNFQESPSTPIGRAKGKLMTRASFRASVSSPFWFGQVRTRSLSGREMGCRQGRTAVDGMTAESPTSGDLAQKERGDDKVRILVYLNFQ